jgi:hypothetical protein
MARVKATELEDGEVAALETSGAWLKELHAYVCCAVSETPNKDIL